MATDRRFDLNDVDSNGIGLKSLLETITIKYIDNSQSSLKVVQPNQADIKINESIDVFYTETTYIVRLISNDERKTLYK